MTTTALERRPEALPTTKPKAAETMFTAVVHDFEHPLALEEVARPTAGPGEIVVRVEASGLCHTDIHAAHGDWPSSQRHRSRRDTRAWESWNRSGQA